MSRNKKFLGFVLLAVALVFSGMAVYSSTIDLPKTGQTGCWDEIGAIVTCAGTGQDGDKLAGAAWPSPRFVAAGTGDCTSGSCIKDNLTGLIWTKNAGTPTTTTPACTGGIKTWGAALTYVACLNGGSGYAGKTDWRLPNALELSSLVNANYGNQVTVWLITTAGFTGVNDTTWYWASTTYASVPQKAWSVWFKTQQILEGAGAGGAEETKETKSYYVWPVRGGS